MKILFPVQEGNRFMKQRQGSVWSEFLIWIRNISLALLGASLFFSIIARENDKGHKAEEEWRSNWCLLYQATCGKSHYDCEKRTNVLGRIAVGDHFVQSYKTCEAQPTNTSENPK